jgi:hypothetical protein
MPWIESDANFSETKFFAYLCGDGGCDYTMACNKKLVALKAQTWEEAEKEAGKQLNANADRCSMIFVIQASEGRRFDVNSYKQESARKAQQKAAKEKLEKDRATYETLKKQFEG